jgi:hypothetical protein
MFGRGKRDREPEEEWIDPDSGQETTRRFSAAQLTPAAEEPEADSAWPRRAFRSAPQDPPGWVDDGAEDEEDPEEYPEEDPEEAPAEETAPGREDMVRCVFCGSSVARGAKVCPNCGKMM